MFVMDNAAFAQAMMLRYLEGKATDSLADRVAVSKIVDLKTARARLRHPCCQATSDRPLRT